MGNFIDITQDLLVNISPRISNAVKTQLKKSNNKTNAELLLNLCKVFSSRVSIELVKGNYLSQSSSFSYSRRGRQKTTISDEEIMVYGAKLIYAIRKFINEDELLFHIASSAGGALIEEATITQEQLMGKLRGDSHKQAAMVAESIKGLKALEKDENKSDQAFRRRYDQIELLAWAQYGGTNTNKIEVGKNQEGKAIYAYQSQKMDAKVYLRFAGSQKIRYYDPVKKINFNSGWLFQQYDSIVNGFDQNSNRVARIHNALNRGSLEPLFEGFKMDKASGTKEGDFQDARNRQIQNKNNNMKIISYNNILRLIYGLEKTLSQYIDKINKSDEAIMSLLRSDFIPDSAQGGNLFANKTIDEKLMKNFEFSKNDDKKIQIKLNIS